MKCFLLWRLKSTWKEIGLHGFYRRPIPIFQILWILCFRSRHLEFRFIGQKFMMKIFNKYRKCFSLSITILKYLIQISLEIVCTLRCAGTLFPTIIWLDCIQNTECTALLNHWELSEYKTLPTPLKMYDCQSDYYILHIYQESNTTF